MKACLASGSDDWETPADIFNELDMEFNFTLDPCASHETAKCEKYYTKDDDGLAQDWGHNIVFMNPPYGRKIIRWVRKAYNASKYGATVVCLIPARTDTFWWHEYAAKGEIRFIRGRLQFVGAKHNAPFPSAIVIFKGLQ